MLVSFFMSTLYSKLVETSLIIGPLPAGRCHEEVKTLEKRWNTDTKRLHFGSKRLLQWRHTQPGSFNYKGRKAPLKCRDVASGSSQRCQHLSGKCHASVIKARSPFLSCVSQLPHELMIDKCCPDNGSGATFRLATRKNNLSAAFAPFLRRNFWNNSWKKSGFLLTVSREVTGERNPFGRLWAFVGRRRRGQVQATLTGGGRGRGGSRRLQTFQRPHSPTPQQKRLSWSFCALLLHFTYKKWPLAACMSLSDFNFFLNIYIYNLAYETNFADTLAVQYRTHR